MPSRHAFRTTLASDIFYVRKPKCAEERFKDRLGLMVECRDECSGGIAVCVQAYYCFVAGTAHTCTIDRAHWVEESKRGVVNYKSFEYYKICK